MRLAEEGPEEGAEPVPAALAAEAPMSRREFIIIVRCEQHGRMKYEPEDDSWHCHGYSGEGCLTAMIVTGDEVDSWAKVPGASIEWSAA